MKKSYRKRRPERRFVNVRVPVELVRLLNAAYAEEHCWRGESCSFVPGQRVLQSALEEHLSKSLAIWLSDFVSNYGESDSKYPAWDVDKLLSWLSSCPDLNSADSLAFLSARTDLSRCGFVLADNGSWLSD